MILKQIALGAAGNNKQLVHSFSQKRAEEFKDNNKFQKCCKIYVLKKRNVLAK